MTDPFTRSAVSQAAKEFVYVAPVTATVAGPRIGLSAQARGDLSIEVQAIAFVPAASSFLVRTAS